MGGVRLVGVVACVLALVAAPGAVSRAQTPVGTEAEQLDRVWENTLVVFPQDPGMYIYRVRNLDMAVKKYAVMKKYPAVVFLHGSTGLFTSSPQVTRIVRDMAAAGYMVFAPNSLDRPHEPYADGKTLKSWITMDSVNLRVAEAKSTYERISKLDFIDADNVFLVGFSMGGQSVANYTGNEFRGYVILGHHCSYHNDRRIDGLKVSTSKPVLAIRGSNDEWYRATRNENMQCGDWMQKHKLGKSVVLPGISHDISTHPEGMKMVVDFMNANLRQP